MPHLSKKLSKLPLSIRVIGTENNTEPDVNTTMAKLKKNKNKSSVQGLNAYPKIKYETLIKLTADESVSYLNH